MGLFKKSSTLKQTVKYLLGGVLTHLALL